MLPAISAEIQTIRSRYLNSKKRATLFRDDEHGVLRARCASLRQLRSQKSVRRAFT